MSSMLAFGSLALALVSSPPGVTSPGDERVLSVLEGRVVTPAGAPAAGAWVESERGERALTAADGSFLLAVERPLDAANVRLSASLASGAATWSARRVVALARPGGANPAGVLALSSGECEPGWVPTFGGVPGEFLDQDLQALAVFDDGGGEGPELYAGPLKWDGETWRSTGELQGVVRAMAEFDDGGGPALYAGGDITAAGGVAAPRLVRWDGASWSVVDSGISGVVHALAAFDDGTGPALYVGGVITQAGGAPASGIVRFDGTSWSTVGSVGSMVVYALAVHDDGSGPALYAGGTFSAAGGTPASHVARWDGASWSALGAGAGNTVRALVVHDDGLGGGPALYAGGVFTSAGGVAASRVARWDGAVWSALGSGANRVVRSLAVLDDGSGPELYAGGGFDVAGGVATGPVARWDGGSWSALAGAAPGDTATALVAFDGGSGARLFATFGEDGVREHSDAWDELDGGGVRGQIRALQTFDDGGGTELLVSRVFSAPGVVSTYDLVRWDGTSWSPLAEPNAEISAMTLHDDGAGPALYVGGPFTSIDGVPRLRVARWDGASWAGLGVGIGQISVSALASHDDGSGPSLFVGGHFTEAGGVPASSIARWDGAAWSALGAGVVQGTSHGHVQAIATFDDGSGPALYVAGLFSKAGGVPFANNVARWDGASWSKLDGGTNGMVRTLLVHDDGSGPALYAGGFFSGASGVAVHGIARWDGSAWSAVGGGMDAGGTVLDLAVFDEGFGGGPWLYAAGGFAVAGGVPASNVARWNGRVWAPLAGGMIGWSGGTAVHALAVFDAGGGPSIFAGGAFCHAPDSHDGSLARWSGCEDVELPALDCPSAVRVADPFPGAPGEVVHFEVTAADDVDPAPGVVCVPPSGSVFPPGTTIVTCTATDAAGNQSECQFPVHVEARFAKR